MEHFDIVLGEREVWGRTQPFGLFQADRRRGLYIIGQTGVGKSSLIRSMIRQDLERGRGCILIDPHGDLAEQVLSDVPKGRVRDTTLVDLAEQNHVVAVNPFYRVPRKARPIVTNTLVSAFRHIWHDNWGTTRLQYILTNVIAALLDAPDHLRPSLLSIPLVLVNEGYRSSVVRAVEDPQVRQFFNEELAQWSDRYLSEALGPIQNRIGQFLINPVLRNTLGQWQPSLDLHSCLDGKRILIVRLTKGLIGEEPANLFGSLVVASLQSAAMQRANIPEENRPDVALYIDEFQTITSTASTIVFAEGRKYGLMLTAAHQYLDQLQDEVRAAVFGNVGSMVAFRCGAEDAPTIARQIGLYDASNYRDLGIGQAYARILIDGESTAPFHTATIPIEGGSSRRAQAIRSWCRERYCRKRADVEQNILRWLRSPWVVDE